MRNAILLAFLLVAGCQELSDPLVGAALEDYQRCTADSDCIIATNGCCCDVAAVNKARLSEFTGEFVCENDTRCACAPRPDERPACGAAGADGNRLCTIEPL